MPPNRMKIVQFSIQSLNALLVYCCEYVTINCWVLTEKKDVSV